MYQLVNSLCRLTDDVLDVVDVLRSSLNVSNHQIIGAFISDIFWHPFNTGQPGFCRYCCDEIATIDVVLALFLDWCETEALTCDLVSSLNLFNLIDEIRR